MRTERWIKMASITTHGLFVFVSIRTGALPQPIGRHFGKLLLTSERLYKVCLRKMICSTKPCIGEDKESYLHITCGQKYKNATIPEGYDNDN